MVLAILLKKTIIRLSNGSRYLLKKYCKTSIKPPRGRIYFKPI